MEKLVYIPDKDVNYPGSTGSVKQAFLRIGATLSNNPKEFTHLALPGNATFKSTVEWIKSQEGEVLIAKAMEGGPPVLAICSAMQACFPASEESRLTQGLGLFEGNVRLLQGFPRPFVGWRTLEEGPKSLFFSHSYAGVDFEKEFAPWTFQRFGVLHPALIKKGNFMATQFHPERSGRGGEEILRKFLELGL